MFFFSVFLCHQSDARGYGWRREVDGHGGTGRNVHDLVAYQGFDLESGVLFILGFYRNHLRTTTVDEDFHQGEVELIGINLLTWLLRVACYFDAHGLSFVTHDIDFGGKEIFPRYVYSKVAHSFQTSDTAVLPRTRKGRENLDNLVLTLEQHLRHTSADTEVSIDLERSVRVVEVVVDTTFILVGVVGGGVFEGIVEDATRVVTILGACPKIYLPSHGPSGSSITAKGECIDRRLEIIIATFHLVERIEAHQVAHVAVSLVARNAVGSIFPLFEEFGAFVDAEILCPVAPIAFILFDVQTFVGLFYVVLELCHVSSGESQAFCAQNVDGFERDLEVGSDQLLCVCRAVFSCMVVLLRRVFVGGYKRTVFFYFVLDHALHPELRALPNGREGLAEEGFVASKAIVIPKVGAIPSIYFLVVVAPSAHTSEDVALGEDRPTHFLTIASPASGFLPTFSFVVVEDIVEEGEVAVGEVGGFCGPVVHLHVDVRVDVGVPRRICLVIPNALQIGGNIDRTTTRRNHQVATIVEVELFEEKPIFRIFVARIAVVVVDERLCVLFGGSIVEIEFHASHVAFKVSHVRTLEFCPRFCGCFRHNVLHLCSNCGGITSGA